MSSVGSKMDPAYTRPCLGVSPASSDSLSRVESGHGNTVIVGDTAGGYGAQQSTQHGTADACGSTKAGPGSSNAANKLDPSSNGLRWLVVISAALVLLEALWAIMAPSMVRLAPTALLVLGLIRPVWLLIRDDNDLDRSSTVGTTASGSTNVGPRDSNVTNRLDPCVDSAFDGHGSHGTHQRGIARTRATPGTGTAQDAAGSHNSDFLNELDPRHDSDLDGSKSIGGNKAHMSGGRGPAEVDTHDTARVPPSVFAAHHGEPVIAHDDHKHNRAGRHGSAPAMSGPEKYGSGTV
ncbi:hypothetical protein FGG08_002587 [Glutinoglossum americanum]|uniref:Uncharacterized protein n=1 Tax=Glutinoglossum americanum TaxID=1670608 RepID=A0A9P8L4D6_9PEZI|nr:hypothetical protein FGG08_002587 [Glutinoglossum americanum]